MRLPILLRHNNLGPILHRFGDIAGFLLRTHPYSAIILGVFPLNQIAHFVVILSRYPKYGHTDGHTYADDSYTAFVS